MASDIYKAPEPYNKAIRAAECVRMSTDQQQFSIAYQQAAIRLYAAQRGMTVTRTYADEGRSGLSLKERPAMKQLLADVESDLADFSRELAVRTHSAQVRGTRQGFLQGGIAGYALRRLLIDTRGEAKGLLPPGASKSFRTDRVIFVPGPPEEIAVVRRIFDLFVTKHYFKKRIARILNAEGVPFTNRRKWNENHIRHVLSNERYVGTLVFGKTSSLLRLGKGCGRIRSAPGTLSARPRFVLRRLPNPGTDPPSRRAAMRELRLPAGKRPLRRMSSARAARGTVPARERLGTLGAGRSRLGTALRFALVLSGSPSRRSALARPR